MTACTLSWRNGLDHTGGGPHECASRHPEPHTGAPVWHWCACGADITEVSTADAVLLQPLPPGACAQTLGNLPALSPLTLDAIERAALACLSPDDARLP